MICWFSFLYFAVSVLKCRGFVISSSSKTRPISQMYAYDGSKATLTEQTTWRLRFSLTGVPTKLERKVGELFSVDVQFREEEGFEPPQGTVVQVQQANNNNESSVSRNVNSLKIKGGRWKLSEDPNDRKDGLWVWGLFSEPLYPFLLLNIETEEYSLTSNIRSTKNDEVSDNGETIDDSILPLKIYAQINHKRDRKTGQVTLEPATLTIRKMETVKADILGVASIELYDEIKVGQLSLRPLNEANNMVRDALL